MEIFFYKGNENVLKSKKEQNGEKSNETDLKKIQDSFLKALDNKNLSFLLGSGCSSFKLEETGGEFKEIGIPVMAPMAAEFYNSDEFKEEKEWLKSTLNIDVDNETFSSNLEVFLSTLHSLSFYHSKKTIPVNEGEIAENIETPSDVETAKSFEDMDEAEKIESIIVKSSFCIQ